ncbi:GGDEF domain-containing protein [Vibrio olivae]|uniref:diguanylate cyclase n=1 Tax=Vibrio olivae TaxID=1243002 RepID=A0ABV5HQX3_9VIBR
MTHDEFKKAAENLKKAIPLMLKNKVATTPENYALWYTYVEHAIPELNDNIDRIIEDFGLCPPAKTRWLYQTYVADRELTDIAHFRENVEILANEVSSAMSDTISDTSTFSQMIDNSLASLENVNSQNISIEEVMKVIRQLVDGSNDIRLSTQQLGEQLTIASTEITRLKEQLAAVQKDVLFDSLSGLYNRRSFDEDISVLCNAKQPMCLVLLDIDHFKSYNDDYGHLFGDTILKGIAKRLQSSCREGISAYRFGGEEFAFIVPNKSLRIARQFAETNRRAMAKLSIRDKRTDTAVGNITASFGVAEWEMGDTPEQLINRADRLLYEAKQLGRNRVMPL